VHVRLLPVKTKQTSITRRDPDRRNAARRKGPREKKGVVKRRGMQLYECVNKMILVAAPVGVVRLAQSDVSYVVICCEVNGRGSGQNLGKKTKAPTA
jgi:hypothetical protein